jgi:branched-subunit amino acid ABC-type transport system permease component
VTAVILAAVFASELALLAMSFNFAYRVTGFANFAHVESVTVGAFLALTLSEHMPMVPAALGALVGTGIVAVALNLAIFQRLREASIGTRMIASAGVALAMRAVIQYIWGVSSHNLGADTDTHTWLGVQITVVQLITIAAAPVVVVLFALALRYTGTGRKMRAVADDRNLAEIRGVRSRLVENQVWFVSGAMAALAGVLVGLNTFVRPELGLQLLIPMFAAAIFGGTGSPYGAILGAIVVSGLGSLLVTIDLGALVGADSYFIGSQYKAVLAFALLVLILMVRPAGFFGEQQTRA